MNWTEEQINSLAPDPASLKAGKSLAIPNKWQNIGSSDIALWGECQGSGSNPYKTQIDFREIAFKCTCPSRKFPCKHSLGILFLFISKKDLFNNQEAPGWVMEWLKSREEKKQKQVERKESRKEADPEKKAKTESKRMDTVEAGILELELWMKDIVRQGINQLQEESYSFFKNISAKMVDAKAPALAKKIDELSAIPNSGKDWAERFLEKLSSIYLIIQGFKNIANLTELLQCDIKTQIGWNYSQEELLKSNGVIDEWVIAGQSFEEDNHLKTRKTYLLGQETGKYVLLLDYSFGPKPFDNLELITGRAFNGEIVFYPSAYPIRGLIKSKEKMKKEIIFKNAFTSIEKIYSTYSEALSFNPFTETIPILLKNIIPVYHDEKLKIIDSEDYFITTDNKYSDTWLILAITGGKKADIFGEWDGKLFYPLTVIVNNKFYSLNGGRF